MKKSNGLLFFFKNEHQLLMSKFDKEFSLAQSTQNWNSLLLICKKQFEDNHHAKEEKYIFEYLKNDIRIKSGGPLCTYYFDFHMLNPTLQRAIEITKKITNFNIEPLWSEQMLSLREKNLPLVIPGEDHEAGRIVLRGIELFLSSPSYNPTSDFPKIVSLFNAYIEIQKEHFAREEGCFFQMCMELISAEKWDQLHNDMCTNYNDIDVST